MKKDLLDQIIEFRNQRDWKQYHNGKDLTISLSLETAELLECFQWSGIDLQCPQNIEKIKEELADVFIYASLIADCYSIDIDQIVKDKLITNNQKYPINKTKGKKDKYTDYK